MARWAGALVCALAIGVVACGRDPAPPAGAVDPFAATPVYASPAAVARTPPPSLGR